MTYKQLDRLNNSLCVVIDRLEDTVKPEILAQLQEVAMELYQESEKKLLQSDTQSVL